MSTSKLLIDWLGTVTQSGIRLGHLIAGPVANGDNVVYVLSILGDRAVFSYTDVVIQRTKGGEFEQFRG